MYSYGLAVYVIFYLTYYNNIKLNYKETAFYYTIG